LRDGRGIKIAADEHPDRFVESVRWLTHEAELIQAIGRARAVNRTDETPVDIDLLFDTPVVAVDEVVPWKLPSLLLAPAATGVMLTSPADLVKCWPEIWPNKKGGRPDTAPRRADPSRFRSVVLPAGGREGETADRPVRSDHHPGPEGLAARPFWALFKDLVPVCPNPVTDHTGTKSIRESYKDFVPVCFFIDFVPVCDLPTPCSVPSGAGGPFLAPGGG
jgi:hypothetical protein